MNGGIHWGGGGTGLCREGVLCNTNEQETTPKGYSLCLPHCAGGIADSILGDRSYETNKKRHFPYYQVPPVLIVLNRVLLRQVSQHSSAQPGASLPAVLIHTVTWKVFLATYCTLHHQCFIILTDPQEWHCSIPSTKH